MAVSKLSQDLPIRPLNKISPSYSGEIPDLNWDLDIDYKSLF